MSDALTNLLAFVVAISVLVTIHEFGHYITGRWMGMKVLRFSVGFGRPLWTWIRGRDRTEYCISAIPLGGYVRFLDSREGPVDAGDADRAFNHRPVPARILVLAAGPLFNFLFAIIAYWALFMNGIPTLQPAVGKVEPGSYAAQAGLEFGDKIVAVGDVQTEDWEDALKSIFDSLAANGRIPLTLESGNGGQRRAEIVVGEAARQLTEPDMLFTGLGFAPWRPPAVLAGVTEGKAGARAGLVPGDRITSVDGEVIDDAASLISVVSARPNKDVVVNYVRDGRTYSVNATIGSVEENGVAIGRLDVTVGSDFGDFAHVRQYGPAGSLAAAADRTWSSTLFTLRMLGRMVVGEVSIKNISGPINIAQFAGDSAARGLNEFMAFLALISISLGVLNLLPVPVLDGGQIVFQAVEMVKGSPLSERSQIIGQQVGILALILLMSFAFYNDIARILG